MAERGDAVAHQAPVHLELALALTEAPSDATARLLAHQVAPHAPEPGQHVLELCQLDLQTPLVRRGVHAEYVENECRPVYDLDGLSQGLLEVGLLRGGELVVEDHHVGARAPHAGHELLDLALADEGARNRRVQALGKGHHYLATIGRNEALELPKGVFERPLRVAQVHAHKDDLLGHWGRRLRLEASHQQTSPSGPSPAATRAASASSAIFAAASSIPMAETSTHRALPSRLSQESCRLA